MDEHLKQRLVGAAVLMALAVIFLPSLFHIEERVVVDTTSQIPPPLIVEPVIIDRAKPPENAEVPPVDKLFQPEPVEQAKDLAKELAETKSPTADTKAIVPEPQKPRLNEQGLPIGWLIQVASLRSESSANRLVDKLLKNDLAAYQQPADTTKGQFFRVLVGPFIDRASAKRKQKEIDAAYKVESSLVRFNPVSGN
ncbi:MAG: SPOR domain-containing protein [Pseudomonadota bacterium]